MSEDTRTVGAALAWAAAALRDASETPRLDAELLLGHVLGWGRAQVLAARGQPLSAAQREAFAALVRRRAALEPVAYLIGHREFYGLDFLVNRHVLVPRPETELLVELALTLARGRLAAATASAPAFASRSSIVIADVGTGSGCIAVALAVHLPEARVYAIDLSPEALAVARQNAERHAVASRVTLLEGDLLAPLPEPADMIVSNLPYTVLSQIDEGVRRHEPRLALDGGPDGLDVYRRLLAAAPAALRPGGAALLEIGATQGDAVAALAREAFPLARVEVRQDLAGLDRVVVIEDAAAR